MTIDYKIDVAEEHLRDKVATLHAHLEKMQASEFQLNITALDHILYTDTFEEYLNERRILYTKHEDAIASSKIIKSDAKHSLILVNCKRLLEQDTGPHPYTLFINQLHHELCHIDDQSKMNEKFGVPPYRINQLRSEYEKLLLLTSMQIWREYYAVRLSTSSATGKIIELYAQNEYTVIQHIFEEDLSNLQKVLSNSDFNTALKLSGHFTEKLLVSMVYTQAYMDYVSATGENLSFGNSYDVILSRFLPSRFKQRMSVVLDNLYRSHPDWSNEDSYVVLNPYVVEIYNALGVNLAPYNRDQIYISKFPSP